MLCALLYLLSQGIRHCLQHDLVVHTIANMQSIIQASMARHVRLLQESSGGCRDAVSGNAADRPPAHSWPTIKGQPTSCPLACSGERLGTGGRLGTTAPIACLATADEIVPLPNSTSVHFVRTTDIIHHVRCRQRRIAATAVLATLRSPRTQSLGSDASKATACSSLAALRGTAHL